MTMRQLTPLARYFTTLFIALLLMFAIAPASQAASTDVVTLDNRYVVQGPDMVTVISAVQEVGGVIYRLDFDNISVGAKLTQSQVDALKAMDADLLIYPEYPDFQLDGYTWSG